MFVNLHVNDMLLRGLYNLSKSMLTLLSFFKGKTFFWYIKMSNIPLKTVMFQVGDQAWRVMLTTHPNIFICKNSLCHLKFIFEQVLDQISTFSTPHPPPSLLWFRFILHVLSIWLMFTCELLFFTWYLVFKLKKYQKICSFDDHNINCTIVHTLVITIRGH